MEEVFKFWTRRIIAFVLTATFALIVGMRAYQGDTEAWTTMVGIYGTILGFYFGMRK